MLNKGNKAGTIHNSTWEKYRAFRLFENSSNTCFTHTKKKCVRKTRLITSNSTGTVTRSWQYVPNGSWPKHTTLQRMAMLPYGSIRTKLLPVGREKVRVLIMQECGRAKFNFQFIARRIQNNIFISHGYQSLQRSAKSTYFSLLFTAHDRYIASHCSWGNKASSSLYPRNSFIQTARHLISSPDGSSILKQ